MPGFFASLRMTGMHDSCFCTIRRMRGLSGARIHRLIQCLALNLMLLASLFWVWIRHPAEQIVGLFALNAEPSGRRAFDRTFMRRAV